MNGAIRVEGAKELRKALKHAAERGVDASLRDANRAAADLVVRRALPNVPVRSGKLRASVKGLASQRDARVKAGGARVAYGPAIHFGRKVGNVGSPPGNRKGRNPIKGRPFLHDAAQASQPEVVAEYERAVNRLVDKIG